MQKGIVRQEDFGKDFGLIHEVVVTGRKVGMRKEYWERLAHNEVLFRRVVRYILRGGYEETSSQRIARQIMGQNFLGPEEVAEHFGILLTQKELKQAGKIPFSEKTLEECRDEFILFLGVNHDNQKRPLTLSRLNQMFPSPKLDWLRPDGLAEWNPSKEEIKELHEHQPCLFSGTLRFDERYAQKWVRQETPELRWYLMRKSVITPPDYPWVSSSGKEKYLNEDEYLERAVVYVYAFFLRYKATDERLLLEKKTWTTSINENEESIYVGRFDLKGLIVSLHAPEGPYQDISIVPFKKSKP